MVAFLNSFMSYLVLFLIMTALVIVGIAAGAFLRKRKDASAQQKAESQTEEEQGTEK